jgi:hypothetical protein
MQNNVVPSQNVMIGSYLARSRTIVIQPCFHSQTIRCLAHPRLQTFTQTVDIISHLSSAAHFPSSVHRFTFVPPICPPPHRKAKANGQAS